jgi:hypothetical protein
MYQCVHELFGGILMLLPVVPESTATWCGAMRRTGLASYLHDRLAFPKFHENINFDLKCNLKTIWQH